MYKTASSQSNEIGSNKFIRPNEKICVFRVTGLKILGREATHFFFLEKDIILCILKGTLSFKMHKKNFFYRKSEIFKVSPVNLGRVGLP